MTVRDIIAAVSVLLHYMSREFEFKKSKIAL